MSCFTYLWRDYFLMALQLAFSVLCSILKISISCRRPRRSESAGACAEASASSTFELNFLNLANRFWFAGVCYRIIPSLSSYWNSYSLMIRDSKDATFEIPGYQINHNHQSQPLQDRAHGHELLHFSRYFCLNHIESCLRHSGLHLQLFDRFKSIYLKFDFEVILFIRLCANRFHLLLGFSFATFCILLEFVMVFAYL